MDWCHYRFRSLWRLPAKPAEVYQVLERAHEYPAWWPQVREVTRLDERTGTVRFRSLLPYDLVVTARESKRDPVAGLLEIAMTGDLDGWARWTLVAAPDATGTHALYEQEVEVCKPLMRRFAVPCRPAFRFNHALMMRGGRLGLLGLLETV
ncbi:SRPBCC family protein [Streptomyces sp. TS71-3]|uniref:SRPBCC family protein n=1 Tax=Streptomyces sp. TS71-3 TaxID=2733862 RepID=UPI001B014BF7|nr:SRPBCC family protein [Streptomyces sp. TS71-3]GHJ38849.1 polyketide cyclase [Streptomyces sp. TS71-3]